MVMSSRRKTDISIPVIKNSTKHLTQIRKDQPPYQKNDFNLHYDNIYL